MENAHWQEIIGLVLPWIQLHVNQIASVDRTVGPITITATEQRIAISFALAVLAGIGLTFYQGQFDLNNLAASCGKIFALSQLAYYSVFRKVATQTQDNQANTQPTE